VPDPAAPPPAAAPLAAFLRGAGLRDLGGADPDAVMHAVGAMLRVMVSQLREIHANRGSIKREFRILATLVRPEDNNPIKFSADNDAALRSLLTGKTPPATALAEVLDEIRLHELAMITAMRDAVTGLLQELNPAQLTGGDGGLPAMLPLQRRARAFQQYEALHARITQALADDFDSVFGKAFARAYERMMLDEPVPPGRKRR
jgi:type VI secretion system protein ImpI/type VI secretion system protein